MTTSASAGHICCSTVSDHFGVIHLGIMYGLSTLSVRTLKGTAANPRWEYQFETNVINPLCLRNYSSINDIQ